MLAFQNPFFYAFMWLMRVNPNKTQPRYSYRKNENTIYRKKPKYTL